MRVADSGLPPHLKMTAVVLALYATEDGDRIYPSVARVARQLGKTERVVRANIATLRNQGVLVTVTAGGGARRTTHYRLNVNALPQPASLSAPNLLTPDVLRADEPVKTLLPTTGLDQPPDSFGIEKNPAVDAHETLLPATVTLLPATENPAAHSRGSSIDHPIDHPGSRTAAAPRFSNLAKAPNGTNFAVVAKIARTLIDEGQIKTFSDLVEATKQKCADAGVDYGRHEAVPFDVVHRACASEVTKHNLGLRRDRAEPPAASRSSRRG